MLERLVLWLVKGVLQLTHRDTIIILSTVVILWTTRTHRVIEARLLNLERHKKKTEAILTALPFMTVGTGVWYTDDTRNGRFKPKFTCVYIAAKEKDRCERGDNGYSQRGTRRHTQEDATGDGEIPSGSPEVRNPCS